MRQEFHGQPQLRHRPGHSLTSSLFPHRQRWRKPHGSHIPSQAEPSVLRRLDRRARRMGERLSARRRLRQPNPSLHLNPVIPNDAVDALPLSAAGDLVRETAHAVVGASDAALEAPQPSGHGVHRAIFAVPADALVGPPVVPGLRASPTGVSCCRAWHLGRRSDVTPTASPTRPPAAQADHPALSSSSRARTAAACGTGSP